MQFNKKIFLIDFFKEQNGEGERGKKINLRVINGGNQQPYRSTYRRQPAALAFTSQVEWGGDSEPLAFCVFYRNHISSHFSTRDWEKSKNPGTEVLRAFGSASEHSSCLLFCGHALYGEENRMNKRQAQVTEWMLVSSLSPHKGLG